ncbi:CLUMA_CG011083, isoform A [Clunio marinus]|uniref:CLUMA_CG011083, isoform A n=1 Tax=Clunio marinus TaxID=568069 RepID=A0A1J1IBP5_9DIPT|nr:CLUMA_CG011083, isoform A [Clunio marinus]
MEENFSCEIREKLKIICSFCSVYVLLPKSFMCLLRRKLTRPFEAFPRYLSEYENITKRVPRKLKE